MEVRYFEAGRQLRFPDIASLCIALAEIGFQPLPVCHAFPHLGHLLAKPFERVATGSIAAYRALPTQCCPCKHSSEYKNENAVTGSSSPGVPVAGVEALVLVDKEVYALELKLHAPQASFGLTRAESRLTLEIIGCDG